MAKKFLRSIAQPLAPTQKAADGTTKGKDSWDLKELERFQKEQKANRGEGDLGRPDAMTHDYMHSSVNGTNTANGVNGHAPAADEFDDDIADEDLLMAESMDIG
jgi:hypothetical protein